MTCCWYGDVYDAIDPAPVPAPVPVNAVAAPAAVVASVKNG